MLVIALNPHTKHPPPSHKPARLHKKRTSVLFYMRTFFSYDDASKDIAILSENGTSVYAVHTLTGVGFHFTALLVMQYTGQQM